MKVSAQGKNQRGINSKIYHAVAAARRYFLLIYKLGADIFRHFPNDSVKILIASGTSLVCQVLAIGLLFVYVRALESAQPLYGFEPRTSIALFAIVAVLTAILLFAFALLEYRSNIAILGLCRRYLNAGAQEVLLLSSKLPHWFKPDSRPWISPGHLRQILSVDVNHRSRMARVLIRALIPSVRLALSGMAILYINPQFSVLIFVIIGIPIAGLYLVGKRIADTITSRETSSKSQYREQIGLLSNSWEAKAHLLPGDIDWEMALGNADSNHRLYFRRLKAKALGQLLINTATTAGIIVLVLSLGFWMLEEPHSNWSLWLTYLIALRIFLASLNRVARAVIQSTRFTRQVRRYMEFIAAAESAANHPEPAERPCPDHVAAAYQGRIADPDDDDYDED